MIEFDQLKIIFSRKIGTIVRNAIVCGLLFLFIGICWPKTYRAEATFRDLGKKEQNFSTLKQLLISSKEDEVGTARELFRTHRLLKGVVEKTAFQLKMGSGIELFQIPIQHKKSLRFTRKGEIVTGKIGKESFVAHIGDPLVCKDGVILFGEKTPPSFSSTVLSFDKGIEKVKKAFCVKKALYDPTLLHVYAYGETRSNALSLLNALLAEYEAIVFEEKHRLSQEQLTVLQEYREKMLSELTQEFGGSLTHAIEKREVQALSLEAEFERIGSELVHIEKELFSIEETLADLKTDRFHKGQSPVMGALIEKRDHLLMKLSQYRTSNDFLPTAMQEYTTLPFEMAEKHFEEQLKKLTAQKQELIEIQKTVELLLKGRVSPLECSQGIKDKLPRALIGELEQIEGHLFSSQFSEKEKEGFISRKQECYEMAIKQLEKTAVFIATILPTEEWRNAQFKGLLYTKGKELLDLIEEQIEGEKNQIITQKEDQKNHLQHLAHNLKAHSMALKEAYAQEKNQRVRVEITSSILTGLSQLTESKFIDRILSLLQLHPIDEPFVPFTPTNPSLITLFLIGFISGGVFSSVGFFLYAATGQLPISKGALERRGIESISVEQIIQRLSNKGENGKKMWVIGANERDKCSIKEAIAITKKSSFLELRAPAIIQKGALEGVFKEDVGVNIVSKELWSDSWAELFSSNYGVYFFEKGKIPQTIWAFFSNEIELIVCGELVESDPALPWILSNPTKVFIL